VLHGASGPERPPNRSSPDEVGDGFNLPAAPKQVNHESPLGEERLSSMNARIPIRALGLLVPLILAPVLARAQVIPSPYRYIDTRQGVGLIFGMSSVSPGRFGYGPAGGTLVGVRWGIDFSGPIGLEALVTGTKGTRDIIDPTHAAGHRHVGTANTLLGTVEGRLRFSLTGDRTWHDLTPFLVTGGGIVFDLAGSQAADSLVAPASRFKFARSFIGTMGGGVRWMVSHRLALRGDAVFSLWKIRTPPGFTDPTLGFVSVAKSEWANGYQVSLSTVIRF
jgi:hypothetical protein